MQQLTEQQYKTLTQGIYNSLMELTFLPTFAANDEAERIVNEWMDLNKITLKED